LYFDPVDAADHRYPGGIVVLKLNGRQQNDVLKEIFEYGEPVYILFIIISLISYQAGYTGDGVKGF
jgi:hypothetical protein